MHLVALNDPDLLLGLWRGVLQTYGSDNHGRWEWLKLCKGPVWTAHGKTVAMATPFIPSSFDRAPRNPAEKINSGYKAWEYLLYFFGLGPALLQPILPTPYWKNYCKLVRGIQILQQRTIPRDQLQRGTELLYEFEREFEELYYQRNPDRIHFVRQSIHLLTHIGHEITRVGPLACYSQWTMETAIGNLGEEIRQDRDPYANISQRGILRAQLNAIKSMLPELSPNDKKSKHPAHSIDLGHGFVLLRACDTALRDVSEPEARAISILWTAQQWPNQDVWYNSVKAVKRWARLRLPHGQIARSSWGEGRSRRKLRRTTIVKFQLGEEIHFGEVRYYFRLRFAEFVHTLCVISVFSQPESSLLAESSHTVYSCHYEGDESLIAIDVKQIKAVVAMIPYFKLTDEGIHTPETEHFLVEKPYMEVTYLRGEEDPDSETEEQGGEEDEDSS
ncbi:hypothetical protein M378DRAFT_88135 [Amanita muscaria Koide BX008]|uniref:Uncharacterized protein n=1 Tax=Amanita muscaria (strain Koide BX008) TaxID=946122 RepID=A0A0C2S3K6_AMAMK|nr:hypothetical protein M378DRAFT_88135 [Amanita muscaria Koide BX008]